MSIIILVGKYRSKYGEDLRKMFPGTKGFATTNLRHMKRYYDMFGEILPQLEVELSDITNLPQLGAEIDAIPWGV